MLKKTKITIDYGLCGNEDGIDPRECRKCLQVCKPAVFLLHQTIGAEEEDVNDPKHWRVTPLWLSLCTKCMLCVDRCPVSAIEVR